MATTGVMVEFSCAVEVFLATALLHREHPERQDFTIQEIVNRVAREDLNGSLRSGINVHASQHCVANKAPNPARHRMLFATGKHTRRLVLPNDEAHPDRTGKIFPEAGQIPESYQPVLEWAKDRFENVLDSADFWADDATKRTRQLRSDSLVAYGYSSRRDSIAGPEQHLHVLLDARGIGARMRNADTESQVKSEPSRAGKALGWLEGVLKLRLAGAHLTDGTDPDDHVRELREGWD